MKTLINYTVRTTRAPGSQVDSTVPVIVDRLQPIDLESVVENCIDRGLIAGLKTTAAHGIAEGIAAQIAREFTLGRGVQFGQYFYGRPYLDGTVDSNGRLTSANSINVRLYKGNAFKLAIGDFSWKFDGAGDAVKVDNIFGNTSEEGGNTYGQIVSGQPVTINGRNLNSAGDENVVTFVEVGATSGSAVTVNTFTAAGDGILTFAWPEGLAQGKTYSVTVSRRDPNGVVRTSAAKKVAVYGAAPVGPVPTATGYESEGMEGEPVTLNGGSVKVNGTNLTGATKIAFRYTEDGEPFYEAYTTEATDTTAECAQLGYAGSVTSENGFVSVITPNGESNKLACTFSV